MNFFYELSIPTEGEEDNPKDLVMPLSYGIITKVQIIIPPGHMALAHLQIKYHEFQLYPLNKGDYHGNNVIIEFDEYQPVLVAPFELKAHGWNEDETYEHTFSMVFTVLRPEETGREIPVISIKALEDLIGKEVEVD